MRKGLNFTHHEVLMLKSACIYFMDHAKTADIVFEMQDICGKLDKYDEEA